MPDGDRDEFNLQEAFELARMAMQTGLVLNGGAAVAILAFYGQAMSTKGYAGGPYLRASLSDFAIGCVLIMATMICGYVIQMLWGGNHSVGTSNKRERWAGLISTIAFATIVAALGFFVAGILMARHAI